jgi:beta-lactamase class A
MTLLSDELKQLIENSGVEVGFAAHQLGSGREILINPDLSVHPASTFKLCVMMEIFHQARHGLFSLDNLMLVKNEFASLVDGSPYSLSAEDDSETDLYKRTGRLFSIRELVHRMITVSSNLATNILIERVTPERTTDFMHQLGADGLIVRRGVEDDKAFRIGLNNAATARGFMNLLKKLAKREAVTPGDSDAMIEILSHQQFNEMIPAQLPSDVRVAHKTGWTGKYYHDVGIVYPPVGNAFVLVIMTNGFEKKAEAHSFVATLAMMVYDLWAKQAK